MRTIYKYPVREGESFSLVMPEGSSFLKVDIQNGRPVMWWIVDTEKEMFEFSFITRGTGHALESHEDSKTYLGSYAALDGQFVGHLFYGAIGRKMESAI